MHGVEGKGRRGVCVGGGGLGVEGEASYLPTANGHSLRDALVGNTKERRDDGASEPGAGGGGGGF